MKNRKYKINKIRRFKLFGNEENERKQKKIFD